MFLVLLIPNQDEECRSGRCKKVWVYAVGVRFYMEALHYYLNYFVLGVYFIVAIDDQGVEDTNDYGTLNVYAGFEQAIYFISFIAMF